MTAHTPDALASALPAGIKYSGQGVSWNTREVAAFQAEAGYVLVHIAPDEATVERLADVIHARMCGCPYGATTSAYRAARETLAALAGTSAQARHTADDATGGGVLEVERDNWIRDRAQSARVADVRDGAAAAADDGGDGAPEAEYCCDFHNRNCEPPSELCCSECTEVNHPRHTPGETCVIAGEQS